MKHFIEQKNNITPKKKVGHLLSKMAILSIIILMVTPAIFAEMGTTSFMDSMKTQSNQSEVTDQELTRFGVALVEVQEIQLEANQQINESISDAEISPERLDEIFMIQQESPDELSQEASEKEIQEFSQIMNDISKIHEEAESEIVESLENNSYDIESFNQMATKINEDSELLNRLQMLFSDKQEGI